MTINNVVDYKIFENTTAIVTRLKIIKLQKFCECKIFRRISENCGFKFIGVTVLFCISGRHIEAYVSSGLSNRTIANKIGEKAFC